MHWDTGGHYSLEGADWTGDDAVSGTDGQQIVANANNTAFYFVHAIPIQRFANHNGAWAEVDNGGVQGNGHPPMAVNSNTSDVFTVSVDAQNFSSVFRIVNAIGVDTSSASVLLATSGLGGCAGPNAPCGAGIYKLNNPDVDNTNIHWRRWIAGLPNPAQVVTSIAGQYEAGANGEPMFFYYAAAYGRGIWKREARGGEP